METKLYRVFSSAQTIFPVLITFTIFCNEPTVVLCEKEVFTSLMQLESLWYREIILVSAIEDMIMNLNKPHLALHQ